MQATMTTDRTKDLEGMLRVFAKRCRAARRAAIARVLVTSDDSVDVAATRVASFDPIARGTFGGDALLNNFREELTRFGERIRGEGEPSPLARQELLAFVLLVDELGVTRDFEHVLREGVLARELFTDAIARVSPKEGNTHG